MIINRGWSICGQRNVSKIDKIVPLIFELYKTVRKQWSLNQHRFSSCTTSYIMQEICISIF